MSKKDEHYVIDLCDEVLKNKAHRQHTFDFLRGDLNNKGYAKKLPVDSFYNDLKLVIEYHEKQHSNSKGGRMTVSGVPRSIQRRIYDQKRRDILPEHGITLIEISYSDFNYDNKKKIIKNRRTDLALVAKKLSQFL